MSTLTLVILDAVLTHDTELFGKMDPFVKVVSDHLKLSTRVHEKGGKKPSWNQPFNIDMDFLGTEVSFTVLDQDLAKQDIVGQCVLKKADLDVDGAQERTLDLTWGPKAKPAGTLRIKWQKHMRTATERVGHALNAKMNILDKVDEARNQTNQPSAVAQAPPAAPSEQAATPQLAGYPSMNSGSN